MSEDKFPPVSLFLSLFLPLGFPRGSLNRLSLAILSVVITYYTGSICGVCKARRVVKLEVGGGDTSSSSGSSDPSGKGGGG